MRRLTIAFLAGGFALTAWLVWRSGAPTIGSALRTVGLTGLVAIAAFHLIGTTLMGLAWWRLLRVGKPRTFIWARLVRDAGSEVLPLSQIGGYVLGARSVIVQGIGGIGVAASTVVDATLEFSAQITYAAIGLALFMWLSPDRAIAELVVAFLCVAVIVAGIFITLQRRRSDFLRRLAERLAGRRFGRIVNNAAAVQAEIQRLARFKRVWLSYLLHLGAWFVSGFEAWLALRLMGVALGFATVLAIESLVHAVRAMAFAVPSALGVQEGAYIILGAAFGLPPEFALGVSLIRRGRDLILGVPAILTWQISESRKRWSGGDLRPIAIPVDTSSAERR